MPDIPLGVLDLVPISSGSTAADALRNSIDLARRAEQLGYARYWFAEHHLNPGVAGTSPAVVLALTAAATSTIRLGSGAVQLGHRTALNTVEEFGLIDALHPGRLDLGLGRSGGRPPGQPAAEPPPPGHAPNGLVIPPRFSFERLLGSPRIALQRKLLLLPGAESQEYAEQIDDLLALLAGTYRTDDGVEAHVVPGEGADVVVAEDDATARELATGYGPWVRSIRTAEGAIEFPTPDEARAHPWTEADQELVQDRLDTQFVGSPATVADRLEQLQEATDADELLLTTITHDHADRIRSYELLAAEWRRRGHSLQSS